MSCAPSKTLKFNLNSLKSIVNDYVTNKRQKHNDDVNKWENKPRSLYDAYSLVRGDHQDRIKHDASNHAANSLSCINFSKLNINDFEELFDFINVLIGKIPGVGGLMVYDIALRIGHLLDPQILPDKYVYLYRGAKEGAIKVLNRKVQSKELKSVFPKEFQGCSAEDIEDILCIYK